MPTTNSIAVANLNIDLSNFRTVPQPDEESAIKAMIAVKPDYFWALMSSLLDSGYLPTENVIVLDKGTTPNILVVKEGNRRIAALKLILGLRSLTEFPVPNELITRINNLTTQWKSDNATVPCAIYPQADAGVVDQIVTLTHGKSEKAGRDQWQAIARARHNRDVQGRPEPALDLLEKYLMHGRNINQMQRERWAGDYPITVLVDAMKKLAPRLNATSSADLANQYPATVVHRDGLEDIINAIGLSGIRFEHLRSGTDFAASYGIPVAPTTGRATTRGAAGSTPTTSAAGTTSSTTTTPSTGGTTNAAGTTSSTTTTPSTGGTTNAAGTTNSTTTTPSTRGTTTAAGTTGSSSSGTTSSPGATSSTTSNVSSGSTSSPTLGSAGTPATPAFGTRDPKAVTQTLKLFTPSGANRQKVVTLKEEALKLKLNDNPLAFCFLLRSMFEISAKAYCLDHPTSPRLKLTRSNSKEKSLAELLKDITHHLTHDPTTGTVISPMERKLHGAITEIAKTEGILSVTSMNQLVHSTTFSITTGDICITFGNIYPLLESMN